MKLGLYVVHHHILLYSELGLCFSYDVFLRPFRFRFKRIISLLFDIFLYVHLFIEV